MWNLVKVDDQWYHVDPTWIDNESIPAYQYLNVTDQEISRDHTISSEYAELTEKELKNGAVFNLQLPACTSEEANYLKNTIINIDAVDDSNNERIINHIVEEVQAGEDVLCFNVTEDGDIDEIVNQMFQKSPYKFLYYVKEANKQLSSDKQIDYNNCRYAMDQMRTYIKIKIAFKE